VPCDCDRLRARAAQAAMSSAIGSGEGPAPGSRERSAHPDGPVELGLSPGAAPPELTLEPAPLPGLLPPLAEAPFPAAPVAAGTQLPPTHAWFPSTHRAWFGPLSIAPSQSSSKPLQVSALGSPGVQFELQPSA
jgi:hypothetical protein